MYAPILPYLKRKLKKAKAVLSQRGQSLIEFMLLLVAVATISFTFVKVVNNQIASRWASIVKIIVDDPSQNSRLNL